MLDTTSLWSLCYPILYPVVPDSPASLGTLLGWRMVDVAPQRRVDLGLVAATDATKLVDYILVKPDG